MFTFHQNAARFPVDCLFGSRRKAYARLSKLDGLAANITVGDSPALSSCRLLNLLGQREPCLSPSSNCSAFRSADVRLIILPVAKC